MKGSSYGVESKNESTMFPKLHQHHHHHQTYPPQSFQSHPQHHHFHASEEDNTSRSSGAAATTTPFTAVIPTKFSEHGDGDTIEVSRRPRGRPPGSKNKPKPPVIITREPEPGMSPYILEIPAGADVIESVARFSRRRNLGLCVLSGSGSVANVTLRQPSTTPASNIIFHGRYEILSISATFLCQTTSSQEPSSANHIGILLSGPQGQVFGGAVAGPLLAASPVFIIGASFNHPSYHRLPIEEEGQNNSASGGNDNNSPPPPHSTGGGDSMFSGHLPSEPIWAASSTRPSPY